MTAPAAVSAREGRRYEVETRGHEWQRDGEAIDIFAYQGGGDYHNGPRCVKCGYGFCQHCQSLPDEDCDGGAARTTAAAKQRMADAAPQLLDGMQAIALRCGDPLTMTPAQLQDALYAVHEMAVAALRLARGETGGDL